MSIITFQAKVTPEIQRAACLNTLADTIRALQNMSNKDAFSEAEIRAIDEAEMSLALMRAKLSMRKSVAELCGQFGKAP